jgi:hypothetical protein
LTLVQYSLLLRQGEYFSGIHPSVFVLSIIKRTFYAPILFIEINLIDSKLFHKSHQLSCIQAQARPPTDPAAPAADKDGASAWPQHEMNQLQALLLPLSVLPVYF